jgi:hypothetical protein
MRQVEKTVFISYRHEDVAWTLAIYLALTNHGYDCFYDRKGLRSGNFERVIQWNIEKRAHFLVLLSPTALKDCNKPGDWLRREIEMALDQGRNIVPLMLEGFSFSSVETKNALTGKLALLAAKNGLLVSADGFWHAMQELREGWLNVDLKELSDQQVSAEANLSAYSVTEKTGATGSTVS